MSELTPQEEIVKLKSALKRPFIGLGVIIEKNGLIAVGERIANHGSGTFMIPGGHLEFGENLFESAKREVEEECGLSDIEMIDIISVGNDIAYDRHYVAICIYARWKSGDFKNNEPDKFSEWKWFDPKSLPQPIFIPSEKAIRNWLSGKIYSK
jgi:8-oxo-dGTP diphosphatase